MAPPAPGSASYPAQSHARPQGTDALTGLVEHVTFHSDETGYCVLKVKVRGERELVPVLGHTPTVCPGEQVVATGEWVIHRDHGRQFKADTLKTEPPTSVEGIQRYLGSGMVKGIGPVLAKRLIDKFGLDVYDVMEEPIPGVTLELAPVESVASDAESVDHGASVAASAFGGKKRARKAAAKPLKPPRPIKPKDTRRLLSVEGIGKVLADRIMASWSEQKFVREIMVYLHGHQVSNSKASLIYKKYGKDAIAKVEADPYCLARDIRGIGFVSADKIAQHMGVPLDSPVRARAGITHVLGDATDKGGHCGLPYSKLVDSAVELLSIPQQTIIEAIDHEIEHGAELQQTGGRDHPLGEGLIETTVDGARGIFLPSLYRAEQAVAHHIKRLRNQPLPWGGFDVEKAIPWVEGQLSITLAETQKHAVRLAVASKALVITGGPGTGKTTLVNSILHVLTAKKVRTLLCAPTGKAAKRMAETTGREAKTIHRLLEAAGPNTFKRNRSSPLDCDLLVVDEASMIDIPLAVKLLDAIGSGTAVIFVGDVDQLPSVGPGQFLVDLINSDTVSVVRLTEVFRQAATSRIICAAHDINRGKPPELLPKGVKSDFYFFQHEEPEEIAAKVVELVRDLVPKRFGLDPIKDIQVLCPMKSGVTGSRNLNMALQQALNPPGEGSVEKYGYRFGLGDKVMQRQNNYDRETFNGDMGVITKIDHDAEEMIVNIDGRDVAYVFGDLDEIELCYAFSVHKSQGSEYPCVIMPISTQHYTMLQRNLIYTGVTRGKSLVICVGTMKAMNIAVRNKVTGRRFSKLVEWLEDAMPPAKGTTPTKAASPVKVPAPAPAPVAGAASQVAKSQVPAVPVANDPFDFAAVPGAPVTTKAAPSGAIPVAVKAQVPIASVARDPFSF